MRRLPLSAALLCLLCSGLMAQGTFPLKYTEATGDLAFVAAMASRVFMCLPEKPSAIKGVPDGLQEPVGYCRAGFGGEGCWLIVGGGDSPRLYVDTDRDNDLANEKAIAGKPEGSRVSFGMVALPAADGAMVKVQAEAYLGGAGNRPQAVRMQTVGCLAATATLAGKRCRVATIDGNFNGRYNDAFDGTAGWNERDGLAIDLDQDGEISQPNPDKEAMEWLPLPKAIRVGDTFYRVTVAPDGSTIAFDKTVVKFGTLDLGTRDVEMLAFSDTGFHRAQAADGKVSLPEGRYMPVMTMLTRDDSDGSTWKLQCSSMPPARGPVEIRPGETTRLELGPPLTAKVDVEQSDRTVRIGLALVGKAGEPYSPGATKGKTQVPPPKVEIVDEAGKVLLSGQFEYG